MKTNQKQFPSSLFFFKISIKSFLPLSIGPNPVSKKCDSVFCLRLQPMWGSSGCEAGEQTEAGAQVLTPDFTPLTGLLFRVKGFMETIRAVHPPLPPSQHSLQCCKKRPRDTAAASSLGPGLQAAHRRLDNDVRPATFFVFPHVLHTPCLPVCFHYRCVEQCRSEREWVCSNNPDLVWIYP